MKQLRDLDLSFNEIHCIHYNIYKVRMLEVLAPHMQLPPMHPCTPPLAGTLCAFLLPDEIVAA